MFKISNDINNIQNNFDLSDIYLIESKNGYNAFSLDKIDLNILEQIYKTTKYVDKDFIKYGLKRGFMTLRTGNDKKYIMTFFSYGNYQKSNSHKTFFIDVLNYPISESDNFDNEKQITITMFPSNKYGFPIEWFRGKLNG